MRALLRQRQRKETYILPRNSRNCPPNEDAGLPHPMEAKEQGVVNKACRA